MLSVEVQEVLRKAYSPQLEKLLEHKLQSELSGLPHASLDKVQVYQGRALAIRELLDELRFAAGISANRTAKPQL